MSVGRGTKHNRNDGVVSAAIDTFASPVIACGKSNTINHTA